MKASIPPKCQENHILQIEAIVRAGEGFPPAAIQNLFSKAVVREALEEVLESGQIRLKPMRRWNLLKMEVIQNSGRSNLRS
jgi:hypothetical protein